MLKAKELLDIANANRDKEPNTSILWNNFQADADRLAKRGGTSISLAEVLTSFSFTEPERCKFVAELLEAGFHVSDGRISWANAK